MLDHSLLLGISSMGQGAVHDHRNVAAVILGKAGGVLKTGQHVAFGNQQPVGNLMVSLQQALGINSGTFGTEGVGGLPGVL